MNLIPFNLEDALRGAPVVTREGHPVTNLIQSRDNWLVGLSRGLEYAWRIDGRYWSLQCDNRHDLFMAPVESIDDIKAEIAELQKLNAELTKEREELKAQAERQSQYIASLNDELNESLNKDGRQWQSISTPPTAEDGVKLPGRANNSVVWVDDDHCAAWIGEWDAPLSATGWTILPAFTPKDEFEEWFASWWKNNQECYLPEVKGSAHDAWNAAILLLQNREELAENLNDEGYLPLEVKGRESRL